MAMRVCGRNQEHDIVGTAGPYCPECGGVVLARRCPNVKCRFILNTTQKFCEMCGTDVRMVKLAPERTAFPATAMAGATR